jgi:hypothetical protein
MSKHKIEQVINESQILLDPESKKAIAKKHGCTQQTVRQSLKFIINSKKAESIRKEAKAILLNQASKIN